MKDFIQQANQLGRERSPFFFLIDFEQKKPIILPLATENDATSGLLFDVFGKTNSQPQDIDKPFQLSATAMSFAEYQRAFDYVQQEIQAGNSYLLNLTCQTEINTNFTLKEIFDCSKAKYKCYFANQFVCFSPECFVKIEQDKIYSYPMKGTINAEIFDSKNVLLNSEKEKSEHNTIVDLIRNDLALVSHNIQVTKYRYLEKIETHRGAIYQTSSEICGELPQNWQENIGAILAKLLPAGSISGAPKVKTVEIIRNAEQSERGYYTGIFGYFDGNSLDSAVAIRYIEQQNGKFVFRSGGGITSQSLLEEEYQEILEKVYVPISII